MELVYPLAAYGAIYLAVGGVLKAVSRQLLRKPTPESQTHPATVIGLLLIRAVFVVIGVVGLGLWLAFGYMVYYRAVNNYD